MVLEFDDFLLVLGYLIFIPLLEESQFPLMIIVGFAFLRIFLQSGNFSLQLRNYGFESEGFPIARLFEFGYKLLILEGESIELLVENCSFIISALIFFFKGLDEILEEVVLFG